MDDMEEFDGTTPSGWGDAKQIYKVRIRPLDDAGDDDDDMQPAMELLFAHTPSYPDEAPLFKLRSVRGLSDAEIASANALLQEQVEANLGMAMIYTLVSAAQEWFQNKATGGRGAGDRRRIGGSMLPPAAAWGCSVAAAGALLPRRSAGPHAGPALTGPALDRPTARPPRSAGGGGPRGGAQARRGGGGGAARGGACPRPHGARARPPGPRRAAAAGPAAAPAAQPDPGPARPPPCWPPPHRRRRRRRRRRTSPAAPTQAAPAFPPRSRWSSSPSGSASLTRRWRWRGRPSRTRPRRRRQAG